MQAVAALAAAAAARMPQKACNSNAILKKKKHDNIKKNKNNASKYLKSCFRYATRLKTSAAYSDARKFYVAGGRTCCSAAMMYTYWGPHVLQSVNHLLSRLMCF